MIWNDKMAPLCSDGKGRSMLGDLSLLCTAGMWSCTQLQRCSEGPSDKSGYVMHLEEHEQLKYHCATNLVRNSMETVRQSVREENRGRENSLSIGRMILYLLNDMHSLTLTNRGTIQYSWTHKLSQVLTSGRMP